MLNAQCSMKNTYNKTPNDDNSMKRSPPLPRIDALEKHQRVQLAEWLLHETLAKTAELLKERYNIEIPRPRYLPPPRTLAIIYYMSAYKYNYITFTKGL